MKNNTTLLAEVNRRIADTALIHGKKETKIAINSIITRLGQEEFPVLEREVDWLTLTRGIGKQGAWEVLMKLGILLATNPRCVAYLDQQEGV